MGTERIWPLHPERASRAEKGHAGTRFRPAPRRAEHLSEASDWYSVAVRRVLRVSVVVLLLYGGLLGLTYFGFTQVPTGFIPEQDQGYVIIAIELPNGASLDRTDEVTRQVVSAAIDTPHHLHHRTRNGGFRRTCDARRRHRLFAEAFR